MLLLCIVIFPVGRQVAESWQVLKNKAPLHLGTGIPLVLTPEHIAVEVMGSSAWNWDVTVSSTFSHTWERERERERDVIFWAFWQMPAYCCVSAEMMTNSKNIWVKSWPYWKQEKLREHQSCLIVLATDSCTAGIMVRLLSGKLS